jgi:hypothetical protein
MTSAILYAAKSTEDRCGSIPTRLADWRAAAEAEGRDVVAHCSDESASARKGNRGPGLERAMAHAERAGAELRVQHSDRLARGDGKRAAASGDMIWHTDQSPAGALPALSPAGGQAGGGARQGRPHLRRRVHVRPHGSATSRSSSRRPALAKAASRAANPPAPRQAMNSRRALRQALDQDQRVASVGETHRPLDQQAPNPLGLIRKWTRRRPRSPAVAV